MASRIIHLAVSQAVMNQAGIKDRDRFLTGVILPDAAGPCGHWKRLLEDGRKTYDLSGFRNRYGSKIETDDLYAGYYLHLVQDLLFRKLLYGKWGWKPHRPGNVERLHEDYRRINTYVIDRYGVSGAFVIPEGIEKEELLEGTGFERTHLEEALRHDFEPVPAGETFFFDEAKADEYIALAVLESRKELAVMKQGTTMIDEYQYAWDSRAAERKEI